MSCWQPYGRFSIPAIFESWIIGGPCVAAGAALCEAMAPARPSRISPAGVLRFALFFAVEAVRGATDVALRAVGIRSALDPGFVEIRVNLPPGAPRILFANALSLLPGTLTADLQGSRATIHVIDRNADIDADSGAARGTGARRVPRGGLAMIDVLTALMVVLMLTLVAGLVRILRGPEDADRMLAAQLLGTGAVAILILMSAAMSAPPLLDVALVFAILALVAVACFAAIDGNSDDDLR